jgi:adenylate kinase
MRVLMIAPPGAGKGTQGALIAAHFNIPHIATGELLRDHVARQTPWARRFRRISTAANWLPTGSCSTWCARR